MREGDETTGSRVCAICRTVLNHRVPDDPQQEDTWEHTFSYISEVGEPDHEPVPVPTAEFLEIEAVCDFCSAHEVKFNYRFVESGYVVQDVAGATVAKGGMSRDWAACSGCARLIDARNINGLVARVVKSYRRKHAADREAVKEEFGAKQAAELERTFETSLVDLYKGLMRGGFRKAEVTPDDPFGQKGMQ